MTMKNFWTEAVVNRNSDKAGFSNPHEYLLAKQREFERDSGVRWSVSHGGGGYMFHPVDEGVPVASSVSDEDVKMIGWAYGRIEKDVTGYVTYLDTSEESGIGLRRLIPIIKWMERQGRARRTVNRMGKGFAFKLAGGV